MAGLDKVETFLMDLGIDYEEIGSSAWLLNDKARGLVQVVVSHTDPVVLIRSRMMPVPDKDKDKLYEALLSFNAKDLIHGAYALDGKDIIFTDTLEFATMDKSELEASLDAVGFALAQHYPVLAKFAGK